MQHDISQLSGRDGRKIFVSVGSLLLACLVCTIVHGCSAGVDPLYTELVQDPVVDPVRSDQLFPNDRFHIRVAGEEELTGDFTVPSVGHIEFPWIGAVDVITRSCIDVATEIASRLADGFLHDPSVSCQLVEVNSRRIDIIGEVNKPGSYLFEDQMTILRAVARAEGFSDDAEPNGTNVLRIIEGRETRIRIPVDDIMAGLTPNFPLQPGDTVVVPRFVLLP